MGLDGYLKRVTPEVLECLRNDKEAAQIFALMQSWELTLRPAEMLAPPERLTELRTQHGRDSTGLWLLEQLRGRDPEHHARIAASLGRFEEEWQDPGLDLGRGWHVLHLILAGSPAVGDDPISKAILGGGELAPGLDDPPVRYLGPPEVAEAASELARADYVILEARSRGLDVSEIYHGERHRGDLPACFEAVRGYYAEAASCGKAMLSWYA